MLSSVKNDDLSFITKVLSGGDKKRDTKFRKRVSKQAPRLCSRKLMQMSLEALKFDSLWY